VPVPVTRAVAEFGPSGETELTTTVSGVTATVKLELSELQKPEVGSCTRALSVWLPSARNGTVVDQSPPALAVVVAMSVEPS
jgi:hypothetical protein